MSRQQNETRTSAEEQKQERQCILYYSNPNCAIETPADTAPTSSQFVINDVDDDDDDDYEEVGLGWTYKISWYNVRKMSLSGLTAGKY